MSKYIYLCVILFFQVVGANGEKGYVLSPEFINKIEGKSAHGVFKGVLKPKFLEENLTPIVFGVNGVDFEKLPHFTIEVNEQVLSFQLHPRLLGQDFKDVVQILTEVSLENKVGKLQIKNVFLQKKTKVTPDRKHEKKEIER